MSSNKEHLINTPNPFSDENIGGSYYELYDSNQDDIDLELDNDDTKDSLLGKTKVNYNSKRYNFGKDKKYDKINKLKEISLKNQAISNKCMFLMFIFSCYYFFGNFSNWLKGETEIC